MIVHTTIDHGKPEKVYWDFVKAHPGVYRYGNDHIVSLKCGGQLCVKSGPIWDVEIVEEDTILGGEFIAEPGTLSVNFKN